jgi:signal transduction histidine kinase
MNERVTRADYPIWVKLSLIGVSGRNALWGYVVLSLLLGAAGAWAAFVDPRLWAAPALALAAIPYWLTIRWVDRHGSWDSDASR